ncbi:FMN-dependent NADH-azoreductase [Alkalilimnicola ehrlichii MLHE-1]|uniref:FMN-dependent NADH:quinone oxidoreductase n=1 Tax=Alkalilimnicola ehrlichii (strain ATCC BAA-1101 / DSM 17681 / MLHE-1) TaxID=187272 RepID=AZOR_ALKEH|nr:NAD(P)H-dependent oxidoreductase [Alkalilimnicola ehrlichii]Q0A5T4.1 RecName: Full=FMN-dependent NADH:quinone oxidoreductase; AltName: Full=Azo-dye reductase; AltName: Full=FMN-dependent NADH-azo compound oxidoreductase; AltName: Full=FMN-dependent NADH-azoreductase [Alkalilimnicola ehrlichii MLHE-1]ABI57803.1 (Acyl-carrier-protein) phosphodiesterase [Alkalilimnicola ehrlichii MLHE-1]
MTTLLLVHSSARTGGSRTREMADILTAEWHARGDNHQVRVVDLADTPPPHVDAATIRHFFGLAGAEEPATASLALSDTWIEQLLQADALAFAVPMYNFSLPSTLKAWLDHVIRPRRTFRKVADGELEGLAGPKPALVMTASGGLFADTSLDHLRPYMKTALAFMGIDSPRFVDWEGTARADIDPAAQRRTVTAQLREWVHAC